MPHVKVCVEVLQWSAIIRKGFCLVSEVPNGNRQVRLCRWGVRLSRSGEVQHLPGDSAFSLQGTWDDELSQRLPEDGIVRNQGRNVLQDNVASPASDDAVPIHPTDDEMRSVEFLHSQSGSKNALSFYDTRKLNGTGHWRLQQDLAVIAHRVNSTQPADVAKDDKKQ
uniref:Uncharacterized protein n=1 Tax=Neospora caninum (strain Liverpool) TaxID=572307 RepID=A0A0F7U999_NEOCL|nr:TPA: hypothetical protein BN1204_022235 [Neospora caninum Liverpool]